MSLSANKQQRGLVFENMQGFYTGSSVIDYYKPETSTINQKYIFGLTFNLLILAKCMDYTNVYI
jgi:hypothetical protein